MHVVFTLLGEKGAVVFEAETKWYPPHVQKEHYDNRHDRSPNNYFELHPYGWDLGYHSYTQLRESSSAMEDCHILGQTCYYDGSSLNALDIVPKFLEHGEEAVWEVLDKYYRQTYGEGDRVEGDVLTATEHARGGPAPAIPIGYA